MEIILANTAEREWMEAEFFRALGVELVNSDGHICQHSIAIFSQSLKQLFRQAELLHQERSIPVLLEGETGTGKEILARYIHYGKNKSAEPFIALNCAAISPTMFESELFGYEAGAFTGSQPRGQKGKLDLAQGGTIFLDEITEIPVTLQAKLLRVIQEKEYYRVGGLKKIKVDTRFICATNTDLKKKVAEGAFRKDLYYRLNVARLYLSPLRTKPEVILPLALMFLLELARKKGKRFRTISKAAASILTAHDWPGNIRELRNLLEWVVLMYDDKELKPCHLNYLRENNMWQKPSAESLKPQMIDYRDFDLPPGSLPLTEYFHSIIRKALEKHNGNKTATTRYLGISRRSLYCRLKHGKTSSIS